MTNQLLILGNGFDLTCGLESRYCDFFKWRFSHLLSNSNLLSHFWNMMKLIGDNDKKDYFQQIKCKLFKDQDVTRWDCIFLCAYFCLEDKEFKQWQDIENIIFNVVSIALVNENYPQLNLSFKSSVEPFTDTGEVIFKKFIRRICQTDDDMALNLLMDLKRFELIFAGYINFILRKHKELNQETHTNYIYSAQDLLKNLTGVFAGKEPYKDLKVDILSFNYSLTQYNTEEIINRISNEVDTIGKQKYKWKINSWDNIHGIAGYEEVDKLLSYKLEKAPRPIFGIDSHDILKDNIDNDPRVVFTKSFRIVNDNINVIRTKKQLNNYDLITIFGHSLGRADYSYFETFFDKCNLYDSNTKLVFYYYPGNNKKDKINNEIKSNRAINNLLTHYGQTLSEAHGENIVNKLILEKRLNVVPNNFIPTQYLN